MLNKILSLRGDYYLHLKTISPAYFVALPPPHFMNLFFDSPQREAAQQGISPGPGFGSSLVQRGEWLKPQAARTKMLFATLRRAGGLVSHPCQQAPTGSDIPRQNCPLPDLPALARGLRWEPQPRTRCHTNMQITHRNRVQKKIPEKNKSRGTNFTGTAGGTKRVPCQKPALTCTKKQDTFWVQKHTPDTCITSLL